jgi:hypothetical protein
MGVITGGFQRRTSLLIVHCALFEPLDMLVPALAVTAVGDRSRVWEKQGESIIQN